MYDSNNIKKLGKFDKLVPESWKTFLAWDKAVMADGAIPAKTKELIAVAVAMTTQCPYCIEIHNKKARAAGCTEQEVAAALRAGGAITHGTHCLE